MSALARAEERAERVVIVDDLVVRFGALEAVAVDLVRGRGRRGVRPPRPQRRGQDHDDPRPDHAAAPRARNRLRRGPRRRPRRPRGPPGDLDRRRAHRPTRTSSSTAARPGCRGASAARGSRAGTAIVVTTHQMEEAERQCERIAIMDRGAIAAIGSPGELRRRFGVRALEDVFTKVTGGRLEEGGSFRDVRASRRRSRRLA